MYLLILLLGTLPNNNQNFIDFVCTQIDVPGSVRSHKAVSDKSGKCICVCLLHTLILGSGR